MLLQGSRTTRSFWQQVFLTDVSLERILWNAVQSPFTPSHHLSLKYYTASTLFHHIAFMGMIRMSDVPNTNNKQTTGLLFGIFPITV